MELVRSSFRIFLVEWIFFFTGGIFLLPVPRSNNPELKKKEKLGTFFFLKSNLFKKTLSDERDTLASVASGNKDEPRSFQEVSKFCVSAVTLLKT